MELRSNNVGSIGGEHGYPSAPEQAAALEFISGESQSPSKSNKTVREKPKREARVRSQQHLSAMTTFPLGPRTPSVSKGVDSSSSVATAGQGNATSIEDLEAGNLSGGGSSSDVGPSGLAKDGFPTMLARVALTDDPGDSQEETINESVSSLETPMFPARSRRESSSSASSAGNLSNFSRPSSIASGSHQSNRRPSVFPLRNAPPTNPNKTRRGGETTVASSRPSVIPSRSANSDFRTNGLSIPAQSPSPPASFASSSTNLSTSRRTGLIEDPSPPTSLFSPSIRSQSTNIRKGSTTTIPSSINSSPYLSNSAGSAAPQSIFATPVGSKPKVGISRLFDRHSKKSKEVKEPIGSRSASILDSALATSQTWQYRPGVGGGHTSIGQRRPSDRANSIFSLGDSASFVSGVVGARRQSDYAESVMTFQTASDGGSGRFPALEKDDERKEENVAALKGLGI